MDNEEKKEKGDRCGELKAYSTEPIHASGEKVPWDSMNEILKEQGSIRIA